MGCLFKAVVHGFGKGVLGFVLYITFSGVTCELYVLCECCVSGCGIGLFAFL